MMTCNGDLRGISGFQEVVMTKLLGSGGLQVTVSSSSYPFPPWDLNLQLTHQRLWWPSICMAASVSEATNHEDFPHPTA
jgi:hypothetical protein